MALIDRDRLLTERMKSMYYHLPNGDIAVPLIDIEHAPVVDAVPVVHGRWIETKHGFCCNQCHTRRPLDWDGQMWLSSFCPNCGARMDGKDGHEEAD